MSTLPPPPPRPGSYLECCPAYTYVLHADFRLYLYCLTLSHFGATEEGSEEVTYRYALTEIRTNEVPPAKVMINLTSAGTSLTMYEHQQHELEK